MNEKEKGTEKNKEDDARGKIKSLRANTSIQHGARVAHSVALARDTTPVTGSSVIRAEALNWHPAGVLVTCDDMQIVVPYANLNFIGLE